MPIFRAPHPRSRRAGGLLALLALAAGAVGQASASSPASLEGRIAASQAREGTLRSGIHADSRQIDGFQGNIDDLQRRLKALQSSLAVERGQLAELQSQLASARTRMSELRAQLVRDKQVLVAQLVASYESPPPSIATVILESHGFADLIERVDDLRAIARENARATVRVASEHKAVTAQAARLADLEARQQRNTAAVLVQRDEVAQLRLALVNRQLEFIRARNRKSSELGALSSHRHALQHELLKLHAQELAAQGNSLAYTGPVGPLSLSTDGSYGFFQAAGTSYSFGSEPQIAERLNTLGKALHLHLIGISGYRSPQHSVEVGGFANDPHTRGEASDTPGVEGVPEATLERFGLTRPFPGAAEADHIQLLGSAR